MRRLGCASLVVLGIFGVAVMVSQVVSSLDDVDVTDEVVQVVRSNEADGRDVVVLSVAQAERWSSEGAPVRRVAEPRVGEANADLEDVFDRLYTAGDGTYDTARLDCLYWPVVRTGRPIEEVQHLYRACYRSTSPRARPWSTAYFGVHQP